MSALDPVSELAALRARVGELEAAEADRRRSDRLADALYRIADAASSAREMREFYAAMHRVVAQLMHAENFYIALYDEERQLLNFAYEVDTVDPNPADPNEWFPMGSGFARGSTAYVLRTGKPIIITPEVHDDLVRRGELELIGTMGEGDWLGVPLVAEGRTIGALVVQTYTADEKYTDADRDLLAFVGRHVATALSRARAIEETRQRNAELAVINGVQEGLAAQLDMDAMYELVGERIRELFDSSDMYIAVPDPASGLVTFPYEVMDGERYHTDPFPLGQGLTSIVLQTGQPLNLGSLAEAKARGRIASGPEGESWLGVPLTSPAGVIGAIVLEALRQHAFGESDVRLLTTIASSLSVALENARLFGETKRLLAETGQRAAELAIINSVQAGLAAELDMQAMYDLVGDKIQEIFDTHVVDLATWDEATDLLHFRYSIERGVRMQDPPMPLFGFRRHVIETGEALLIDDVESQSVRYGNPLTPISGEPAKSLVLAPLHVGGRVGGVVSLQNLDREDAFTAADMDLLVTIARSLSVALENARLVDETRRRAAELEIVNRVGAALTSQLDLEPLIRLVGEELRQTFGADIVYVALLDAEAGVIEFPYYNEDGRLEPQGPIRLGEGLTSRILASREPLLLNQDAQFEAIGTRGVGTLARSYLGVPIMAGDDAIGVVSVQSTTQVGRFAEDDARLLSTIAASVGAALRNARLYRAQQQGEEQYRRLVEELPLALYTDRPDGTSTSTYMSPQVEAMFGYPRESWLEEPFFASVVHPDDHDRIFGEVAETILESDATRSYEYRIIAADGRVVWVRDDVWVVRDADGAPLHIQGFMMDVTEQTLAAAEIRRQKTYFESLVNISPVAVVTMDPEDRVTGWNPAAARLFGYTAEEAMGRPIDDLVMGGDALPREGVGIALDPLASGETHVMTRRARKDGSLVDVELDVVPLVVDGENAGFYAIYHDVTELHAARVAAEAANQAKSTFLAAMSHEIRTPLNAVIGMSGLLLHTELDTEQRDFAETIVTSGEALLTIINDILDFSKIEAGRTELESLPFPLRATLEGALDVMAPTAGKKGVELAYTIDEDLPQVLSGDAGRLRQIVLNLLSNAIKFTAAGEVVLSATGHRLPRPGRSGAERWEVVVEVRDTGIGIPPDRIGRLFQSFSQVDASVARRFGGTGLGLAISRRLAELMDGSLVAESTGVEGEGSTFRLTIRADVAAVSEPAPALAGPLPALVGRRALIVDDNATNRRIVAAQVRRWGIESRDTALPREALDWVRAGERFDVALIDMNMPEMDGYALADALRQLRTAAELPIVVLSSVGGRDRDAPVISAFLTKPVKPSALHDALADVLADEAAPRARAVPDRPVVDAGLASRHPLRLLLAEDNAVNQKLALRLLAQYGYTADVAANGLEAVDALERTTYDLVLMDVQMPEMDGLEATRAIRARWPATSGPRIVAMTANALSGDREACLDAGMDDYITKPIRPSELAAALAATPPAPAGGPDA